MLEINTAYYEISKLSMRPLLQFPQLTYLTQELQEPSSSLIRNKGLANHKDLACGQCHKDHKLYLQLPLL